MKNLFKVITRNWVLKLVSLLLAVLVWYLIKQQVRYSSPIPLRDINLPNAQWTD